MDKNPQLESLLADADSRLLAGKAIVITGAGGGIGRMSALFAVACGARVVVNDVRREAADAVAKEIDPAGKLAVASHDAVQQWAGAAALVDLCVRSFGRIDGLVNSAGLAHNALPWEEPEDEIRALLDVNVMGTIFCARHAMPHMMKQKTGSIVNLSSGNAFGTPNSATYSASKAAVASATFSWAFDLMPFGVRANAICPYATTHIKSYWQDVSQQLGYTHVRESTAKEIAGASSPSKPAPENHAPLIAYLLSDRARRVTSQFIQLHGKRMTLIPRHVDQLNAGPFVEAEPWTLEGVARAFTSEFSDKLQPVADYMMRYPAPAWPEDANVALDAAR